MRSFHPIKFLILAFLGVLVLLVHQSCGRAPKGEGKRDRALWAPTFNPPGSANLPGGMDTLSPKDPGDVPAEVNPAIQALMACTGLEAADVATRGLDSEVATTLCGSLNTIQFLDGVSLTADPVDL